MSPARGSSATPERTKSYLKTYAYKMDLGGKQAAKLRRAAGRAQPNNVAQIPATPKYRLVARPVASNDKGRAYDLSEGSHNKTIPVRKSEQSASKLQGSPDGVSYVGTGLADREKMLLPNSTSSFNDLINDRNF